MVRIENVEISRHRNVYEYIGFLIRTDDTNHDIHVQIENFQSCCEDFGIEMYIKKDEESKEEYDNVLIDSNYYLPELKQIPDNLLEKINEKVKRKEIIKVNWKDVSKKIGDKNVLEVYVFLSSDLYLCMRLFNEHIGYYLHNTRLKWYEFEDNENNI